MTRVTRTHQDPLNLRRVIEFDFPFKKLLEFSATTHEEFEKALPIQEAFHFSHVLRLFRHARNCLKIHLHEKVSAQKRVIFCHQSNFTISFPQEEPRALHLMLRTFFMSALHMSQGLCDWHK